MLLLYKKCYALGYFPKFWKKRKVIFFRKRNRDPKLPRSYRPITLLPIMGKVYQTLLKMRLMTTLESRAFLHKAQHGFTESHSTITAMIDLKTQVKEILQINKYCTAVSLDNEGAFDAMCWLALSEIIYSLPVDENLK